MKIAKQSSEDKLWKSIQSGMSYDTHLTAMRSFEKVRQSKVSAKDFLTLRQKLLSDRSSVRFFPKLERAKFRDSCPSLHVIEISSKNWRSPYARAFDQGDHRVKRGRRGVRKTQSIHTSHEAPQNRKRHYRDVHHTNLIQKFCHHKGYCR